jgi:hypothetical protein
MCYIVKTGLGTRKTDVWKDGVHKTIVQKMYRTCKTVLTKIHNSGNNVRDSTVRKTKLFNLKFQARKVL